MKILVALLAALSVTLGVTVWQLESRPADVVSIQPDEELPWAIFIDICGEFAALIWTTEPPTWFMPDGQMDAEQVVTMNKIMLNEQWQLANLTSPVCAKVQT
jgi:hypothetical protein